MLATFFVFTAQFILASAKTNVFQTETVCREMLHFEHDFIKTTFVENKRRTLDRN